MTDEIELEIYNPRWVAYARSIGSDPGELVSAGGPRHEFMAFISRELRAYCDCIGRREKRLYYAADHRGFTEFLLRRYPGRNVAREELLAPRDVADR